MRKIGVTGAGGFIGIHLLNTLRFLRKDYEIVPFLRDSFSSEIMLDEFVAQCDVIVHLAALNRHENPQDLYLYNIDLVAKLQNSLVRTHSKAHVLFTSSTQEERNNHYGNSKRKGRQLLRDWAKLHDGRFTGIIVPNVFGPFGRPYYNSFIATFCHQLCHGIVPKVQQDSEVDLIFISDLVEFIIRQIDLGTNNDNLIVPPSDSYFVSRVLDKLSLYKQKYMDNGEIPMLQGKFELQLFNTFRSYIPMNSYFPRNFVQNVDERGAFVEIIRLGIGGQCSFSTTHPNVTRGNHFHTRKIERFAVIKGKAQINLRRVDSMEVLSFELDGAQPSYVDMPIWYTHNIVNTGSEEVYTIFWINEPFNSSDSDTYFVEV